MPFAGRCAAATAGRVSGRARRRAWSVVRGGPIWRRTATVCRAQPKWTQQLLRRLGRRADLEKVHTHRFRHTFATWAISHDPRELDVQYLLVANLGVPPDMVAATRSSASAATEITCDSFFEKLSVWLTEQDILVADAGFPLIGAQGRCQSRRRTASSRRQRQLATRLRASAGLLKKQVLKLQGTKKARRLAGLSSIYRGGAGDGIRTHGHLLGKHAGRSSFPRSARG